MLNRLDQELRKLGSATAVLTVGCEKTEEDSFPTEYALILHHYRKHIGQYAWPSYDELDAHSDHKPYSDTSVS